MFSARYADVDPDINPELIRSKLIREMIGQYDCLTEWQILVKHMIAIFGGNVAVAAKKCKWLCGDAFWDLIQGIQGGWISSSRHSHN